MPTTLNIDPELVQIAMTLEADQTLDAIVEHALRRYVEHCQQTKLIELFGTIEYEEDYDYKKQRAIA
jgi:Bacterial antitoxin of type II TA system, VapB